MNLLNKIITVFIVIFALFIALCYIFDGPAANLKSCSRATVRRRARLATRHRRIRRQQAEKIRKEDPLEISFGEHRVYLEGADTYVRKAKEKTEQLNIKEGI